MKLKNVSRSNVNVFLRSIYPLSHRCSIHLWWFRAIFKELHAILCKSQPCDLQNGSVTLKNVSRSNVNVFWRSIYPLSYKCSIHLWWFRPIFQELHAILWKSWPYDLQNGPVTLKNVSRSNVNVFLTSPYPLSYMCSIHLLWFGAIFKELHGILWKLWPCDLEWPFKVISRGCQGGDVTFHKLWSCLHMKIYVNCFYSKSPTGPYFGDISNLTTSRNGVTCGRLLLLYFT